MTCFRVLLTLLLLSGDLLAQTPADESTNRCPPVCSNCNKQSFSIRADDGTHFTLIVEFEEYRWGLTGTHWYRRAFVTYSASCLSAYDVTYHKWQKTIEAWGDVRFWGGTGKQERFDAVLFKINNGTLTPIKLLHGKEHTAF